MANTTTFARNDGEHSSRRPLMQDEPHERIQNGSEESDIEHVKETGLPPGIEADDLFNPNGNRPRDVPNGNNS